VAVGPARRGRIVAEHLREEGRADFSAPQGQARMARFGLLHRVGRQRAHGVSDGGQYRHGNDLLPWSLCHRKTRSISKATNHSARQKMEKMNTSRADSRDLSFSSFHAFCRKTRVTAMPPARKMTPAKSMR